MNYGFVRVGAAVPELKVANCIFNAEKIVGIIKRAEELDIQILVFPELSVTAYTCADLFHQQALQKESVKQLDYIIKTTKNTGVISIIGIPLVVDNQLFNCGVVIKRGSILGIVPKTFIPAYSEFYEKRWFASGQKALSQFIAICGQQVPFGTDLLFEAENETSVCFGIEICEDLWVPIPPSSYQAIGGATILFNLSASNEVIGKHEYRSELVRQQSAKCIAGYVYTSANICESTTDLVFGGHAIIAEYGSIIAESERFKFHEQLIYTEIDTEKVLSDRCKNTSFMEVVPEKKFRKIQFELKDIKVNTLNRHVDANPFVPSNPNTLNNRCSEIFSIQTAGLGKRLNHTGMNRVVLGISGGLDSTLALLVTVKTFDILGIPRENIHAVTMPGFGTTDNTYNNAIELMKAMGVNISEVDIKAACLQHFKDICHDVKVHDVTYENVQARERTQILMDIANKVNGLLIGTGDLSELALGWCTYNGDHMSMYSVNCGIPKTLVKFLVKWVAQNIVDEAAGDVLQRILDTPISPELLPPDEDGQIKQKTEDLIGPYELHDFFLYHIVRYGAAPRKVLFLAEIVFKERYSRENIMHWLKLFYRRFFNQQFKRSCLPDGPKVGTISLSPRGDWRMPSDADVEVWLGELNSVS